MPKKGNNNPCPDHEIPQTTKPKRGRPKTDKTETERTRRPKIEEERTRRPKIEEERTRRPKIEEERTRRPKIEQDIDLKDMFIDALVRVGGIDYLIAQAEDNPKSFMTLLGKVLPMTVAESMAANPASLGGGGNTPSPFTVKIVKGLGHDE